MEVFIFRDCVVSVDTQSWQCGFHGLSVFGELPDAVSQDRILQPPI